MQAGFCSKNAGFRLLCIREREILLLISVLRNAFSGQGLDLMSVIASILASLLVIFVMLPFHEFAHATVAGWFGDKTAKMLGRQTLNPLKHIDYVGALLLLLFGFGWAKPVPVNLDHRKNPKGAMAVVALAGPLANLLAGIVGGLLINLVLAIDPMALLIFSGKSVGILSYIVLFLYYFMAINISLAVFNLIPIPPLDGSKILMAFLPNRICYQIQRNEAMISMILMIAIAFGAFSGPLSVAQSWLTSGILNLTALPFSGSPFNPNFSLL